LALWRPGLPASGGVTNSLRYARAGNAATRWFSMLDERRTRPGWRFRTAMELLMWGSRLAGRPLAPPEPLAIGEVDRLVDWIAAMLRTRRRCALQTYASQAVRVSRAARARGRSLTGAVFLTGSEPLTSCKCREITACGARVYPRYMATEIGTIGCGCGAPAEEDDMHLVRDTVAVIPSEEGAENTAAPLLFTSFLDTGPTVMLNVSLGDTARVVRRDCGCPLGALGFHTHLLHVRSVGRATGEGMTLGLVKLARVVETALVPRYGGCALDYQWIEQEDARLLTQLRLRVAPRLGDLDEAALARDILDALAADDPDDRLVAEMWRQAGTLRVVREEPQPTPAGKVIPLLRER
jgi:hypothetical protein